MVGPDWIGLAALLVVYFSIAYVGIEVRRWPTLINITTSIIGGLIAFAAVRHIARLLM